MEPIVIIGVFGDRTKTLEITKPFGSGGIYHVFIDRYYQGMIQRLSGQLVAQMNPSCELTTDDLQVIFERITEKEKGS